MTVMIMRVMMMAVVKKVVMVMMVMLNDEAVENEGRIAATRIWTGRHSLDSNSYSTIYKLGGHGHVIGLFNPQIYL